MLLKIKEALRRYDISGLFLFCIDYGIQFEFDKCLINATGRFS